MPFIHDNSTTSHAGIRAASKPAEGTSSKVCKAMQTDPVSLDMISEHEWQVVSAGSSFSSRKEDAP